MGANPLQTLKAFREAESYRGPSLIIAYSHCIAHGIDMTHGDDTPERRGPVGPTGRCTATTRGWPHGEHPFHLDSRKPTMPFKDLP